MASSCSPPYAAGILPFARHNNKTFFLLGRDAQDGFWSDFGGKHENRDRTELDTAQREFYEETCGCVLDLRSLKVRMSFPSNYLVLHSTTQSKHPYYMYLMQIPFEPNLRSCFKKTLTFLRFMRFPRAALEKNDLMWVDVDDMMGGDLGLRSVFLNTITRHLLLIHAVSQSGALPRN